MAFPAILRSIELIHYIRNVEKNTLCLVNEMTLLATLNEKACQSATEGWSSDNDSLDLHYQSLTRGINENITILESCLMSNFNYLKSVLIRAENAIEKANKTVHAIHVMKLQKERNIKTIQRFRKMNISPDMESKSFIKCFDF